MGTEPAGSENKRPSKYPPGGPQMSLWRLSFEIVRVLLDMLGLVAVVFLLLWGSWNAYSYIYSWNEVDRTTEIRCVDAVTGNALHGSVDVTDWSGSDVDWNPMFSAGPGGSAGPICTYNVPVDVKITSPGHKPVSMWFNDKTPKVLTVKMQPLRAAAKPRKTRVRQKKIKTFAASGAKATIVR